MIGTLLLLAAHLAPQEALDRLIQGNQRYMKDQSEHPNRTAERRKETSELQEPFATILGCSDSRVSPEIIFDQGLGDLFIVRVAGNVVGDTELDSIEYSVLYLHSSLIVVLGHENCGAVKAVIAGTTKDIESVADLIQPAVDRTKKIKVDRLDQTIKANVDEMVARLRKSPPLSKMIREGKLSVVGAYYDFHKGRVELLN